MAAAAPEGGRLGVEPWAAGCRCVREPDFLLRFFLKYTQLAKGQVAEVEEYAFSQGRRLRCGYTTGSCAAAAAQAATHLLLGGGRLAAVGLATPKGTVLQLSPLDYQQGPGWASCAVQKDSGDDPDITDGLLVYAKAELRQEPGIAIQGGPGVGRVTQPGLACAPGEAAINPVPRRMIEAAARGEAEAAAYSGGLLITISLPRGEELAKLTFNPRLGIVGGLSILGTSGIVEPMSDRALIQTLYLEMDAQKARGTQDLLAFFGNYGEDYAREVLHLDLGRAVTCSNFVGELLDYAAYLGFRSLLLIGHSGKLVKLAQGVMNTHSKYADCRTESLALGALFAGAPLKAVQAVYAANTTDEGVQLLKELGLLQPVMAFVCQRIAFYLQHRVHGRVQTAALVFSNVHGLLGQSPGAAELLALHRAKE